MTATLDDVTSRKKGTQPTAAGQSSANCLAEAAVASEVTSATPDRPRWQRDDGLPQSVCGDDHEVTTTNFSRFGRTVGSRPGQRTRVGPDNKSRAS